MHALHPVAYRRTVIGRSPNGLPRTYRLHPAREAAYRRLATAILGLDVASLASELRAARRAVAHVSASAQARLANAA
jgi:hypothetical protein